MVLKQIIDNDEDRGISKRKNYTGVPELPPQRKEKDYLGK
jgi:hypothetical protein